MFSYPSGAKLHVGHWYNYGPADSYARFKRMQGYNVFHPMGFDAFGLPAENFAIKTGIHPRKVTDMNIEKFNINEAYLNFEYDLVDKTTIAGSYYKEFGEEVKTEGEKLEAGKVFNDLVNKYILSEFDSSSIKLFTVVVPLGTTPLTFNFDIMLHIGVNGRMTITVTSEEYHGISVINNKVSRVNDVKVLDRVVDIYGEFEIMLGLGVGLGLFGYTIVDVEVFGGVGAWVEATARFVDENGEPVFQSTYAVPIDYLAEVAAGMDFEGDIQISGHADVYGILKIGVGENSVLSLVGLCKTWTIYDRTNATFASIEFEC